MTHADAIAGFLAEIIANPADDDPRLTFADWLEEHGQCERAELIRVQCRLANRPSIHQVHALECRAAELLATNWQQWLPESDTHAFRIETPIKALTKRRLPEIKVEFHRGFISQVECTLETWRGRTCERCGGGSTGTLQLGSFAVAWTCPHCDGVGRVGGIGPQLVRRAPVESVVVTDREPFGTNECSWYDINRPNSTRTHPQSDLPTDLYAALEGEDKLGKFYPSADAANAALSAALLAESRAALEPSGLRVVQCGT